jgi:dTDP-4-amino-4,6-dideoxygalactose transaminase
MKNIGFNKPYLTGKETQYINQAVKTGKISGNGFFTQKCQYFFQEHFGFGKCLLTSSCTDALEMAAILCGIQPNDEVIVPSYTFVSTANAFILRGAKIIFADSMEKNPNLDADKIESLITSKTKAIVPVHYAGIACDMEKIMYLASKYNLYVIEDAAQAIDSYFIFSEGTKKALGSIGHFAAFSFHETKNIISGEGGMLVVNDSQFMERSEIIWEKGTNRSSFFRGEVDKYGWVDIGSSFLPSDITAAFLWAQLECLVDIQKKRFEIWRQYNQGFLRLINKKIQLPYLPSYTVHNAHMYYLVFPNRNNRTKYIDYMKKNGVNVVFHYQSLHQSQFYIDKHDGRNLLNSDNFTDCLVRLPIYFDLTLNEIQRIIDLTIFFWENEK